MTCENSGGRLHQKILYHKTPIKCVKIIRAAEKKKSMFVWC